MKKIAALIGAGALLLSVAGSALAILPYPMFGSDNVAVVQNEATAIANTGGNTQNNTAKASWTLGSSATAGSEGNRNINTGDADAYAGALVVANTHVGCGNCVVSHDDDVALVGNGAAALADTGSNEQDDYAKVKWSAGSTADAGSTGNRTTTTGDASATARAWTIVNTHLGWSY